jgi:MSHA pilin protein MshA
MKKSGFTLIELVVVIVILGLLAVVAAPKFVDLTSDAKASVIKNISGNLTTAIGFALMKDKIAGGKGEPIDYNGNTVTFTVGNPTANATQMRYLLEMELPSATFTPNWSTVPCEGSEFCVVGNRPFSDARLPPITEFTSGTGVFIWPEGYILDDCFTYYLNLEDGGEPIVDYVNTGC